MGSFLSHPDKLPQVSLPQTFDQYLQNGIDLINLREYYDDEPWKCSDHGKWCCYKCFQNDCKIRKIYMPTDNEKVIMDHIKNYWSATQSIHDYTRKSTCCDTECVIERARKYYADNFSVEISFDDYTKLLMAKTPGEMTPGQLKLRNLLLQIENYQKENQRSIQLLKFYTENRKTELENVKEAYKQIFVRGVRNSSHSDVKVDIFNKTAI